MLTKIDNPSGKPGVLIPGLGAVSTTFIAGVELIRGDFLNRLEA